MGQGTRLGCCGSQMVYVKIRSFGVLIDQKSCRILIRWAGAGRDLRFIENLGNRGMSYVDP